MKNQVQLITYVDRIGGETIADLHRLLQGPLKDMFGGVHLLPFYDPIDGEDAGFDPVDHTKVDHRLGTWEDVRALGTTHDVMADVIVNHMSALSTEFQDYLQKGQASVHADLFLTFSKIFPQGASEEDLLAIYRPRPGFPFTKMRFAQEGARLVWTTFTANQIDIDVTAAQGKAYLDRILKKLQDAGVKMIRLDAAGYALKKAGTSCFMLPETFEFIDHFTQKAKKMGMSVLVEVHSFYKTQVQIAEKVDYVYDFALPVLVLDTLFNRNARNLKHWLQIGPRNCITVLDTHDGIGIVDVASENGVPGLIDDDALDAIVGKIHENSGGNSKKATGAAASNLDLYQVNCTYFEALGRNGRNYLLARAIQFFVPGLPQVYYVGLFAGENDMQLLQRTGVGRDINRHYFSKEEVREKTGELLFRAMAELMRLRNRHPAFNGDFELVPSRDTVLELRWSLASDAIGLHVDLEEGSFNISGTGPELDQLEDFHRFLGQEA
ncbi:sucrose phosphorylase [Maribacter sp. 2307ULW6-5]|uniref:sucrose phosphorylase n=1 Tax=Maribacter sp. 2307ULW6-5 TaxID=3386275 RepID=UPI0039BD34E5